MGTYWEDQGKFEAQGTYRIVSGDGHVNDPPDLWLTRVDRKYRDRVPRLVDTPEGTRLYCDGMELSFISGQTQAGRRYTDPENFTHKVTWEDVRPGGYIPEERVKDMDIDGVEIDIVFPSAGNACYRIPDTELLTAICRAYNDWLVEFCSAYPKRLKGVAMLNTDDVPAAINELERCIKLGMVAGMMPLKPLPDRPYNSPVYDRLWAAAQDMQVPLCCHTGTTRMPLLSSGVSSVSLSGGGPQLGSRSSDAFFRDSLCDMIYGRVFERYPKLVIGCMEMGIGWVPFFMRSLDRGYVFSLNRAEDPKFKDGALPSDFIRRNIFFGFQDDDLGIRIRDVVGVDNLVFSDDYPHHNGTWPRSRQVLEQMMAGCPEEEKAKMAGGNAVRIFRLD